MATLRISCIATVACFLLTLEASSALRDWPFSNFHTGHGHRRHMTDQPDLAGRDLFYPGLGHNFDDFSIDSSGWTSVFNKLFPDLSKNLEIDENHFQVKVSMVGFTKGEVNVRVKDGFVVITGRHEPSTEGESTFTNNGEGYKQFVYKYNLPEDTIVEEMRSRLTSDGELIVSAPRSGVKKVDKGYEVPVQTDEDNAIPSTKKVNEFYDEDSVETVSQATVGDATSRPLEAIISISKDGDEIDYEFDNV